MEFIEENVGIFFSKNECRAETDCNFAAATRLYTCQKMRQKKIKISSIVQINCRARKQTFLFQTIDDVVSEFRIRTIDGQKCSASAC